jgi:HTH-type transcriptional regulator, cell division transcriptional repressor
MQASKRLGKRRQAMKQQPNRRLAAWSRRQAASNERRLLARPGTGHSFCDFPSHFSAITCFFSIICPSLPLRRAAPMFCLPLSDSASGPATRQTMEADRVSDATNIYEEKPDLDTIGGRLSRARDASGLTVKELAWRLGVKMATINAWESDRSQPGSHRLTILAGILQVSLSWILHGVGTAPSDTETSDDSAAMNSQIDRLRHLHAETGQIIDRLQTDIDRLSAA